MSQFVNGAWVSRVYVDMVEGEVVAAFQYINMACDFARTYMAGADAGAPFHMIVTNCQNGEVRIFRQPPPDLLPLAKDVGRG